MKIKLNCTGGALLATAAIVMLLTPARHFASPPTPPTSLFEAVKAGDLPAIERLLVQGADVNATDAEAMTPLHYAAFRGDRAAVEALLSAGAKVNASDRLGITPLEASAYAGNREVVALLLAKGASPGARDRAGMSALHYAAAGGHEGAAEALLAAGADPTGVTVGGQIPADIAAKNGHSGLAETLRSRADQRESQPPRGPLPSAEKSPRVYTNADLPNGGLGDGSEPSGAVEGSTAIPGGADRSESRQGRLPGNLQNSAEINDLYAKKDKLVHEKREIEDKIPQLRKGCEGLQSAMNNRDSNITGGPGVVVAPGTLESSRRAKVDNEVACRPLRQTERQLQEVERKIAEVEKRIESMESGHGAPPERPSRPNNSAPRPTGFGSGDGGVRTP